VIKNAPRNNDLQRSLKDIAQKTTDPSHAERGRISVHSLLNPGRLHESQTGRRA